MYEIIFLLAVLKHTNKQSTLSAVLLENPVLFQSRNSLPSLAAKSTLH